MKLETEVQTTPYKPVETIKTNQLNDEGENNMENGLSTTGYVRNAMYDNIRYGAGYGYGGGYAPFAGPGSNAVRINRNAELTKLSLDRVSDQNEETRRNLGEARIFDTVVTGDNRICDSIAAQNNAMGQNMLQLTRELAAVRAEAAECCCETKLLIKDTTIDNLRAEAATNNKNEILNAMAGQTNALNCAIQSLNQTVQNICAPRCPTPCPCPQ